ncbi:MAG: endonuclease/exonuclease/phosphatase family protein [Pseudomonadota bacterium]
MARLFLAALGSVLVLGAAAAIAAGFLGPIHYNYDAFAHLRLQFSLVALGGALLLAVARALRSAALGAAVAALGGLALGPAWGVPVPAPDECVAARLSVAIANVHDTNADFDPVVDAILAVDADIVATAESVPRFWSATAPLRARYPHRLTHFPEGGRSEAVLLWSKRPLRPLAITEQEPDAPGFALATIDLDGRAVAVAGLHASRPVLGPQRWQFEGVGRFMERAPAARIVMGDFNATLWSHGMALAQKNLGATAIPGFRVTWKGRYPNPILRDDDEWKPPSLIGNQIDHVLISAHFAVEAIETFALPGSVHRGVKARLQLLERADGGGAPGPCVSAQSR